MAHTADTSEGHALSTHEPDDVPDPSVDRHRSEGFWSRVGRVLTRPLWDEPPRETIRRRTRFLLLGPVGAFLGLIGAAVTGVTGGAAFVVVPGMALLGLGLMHVVTSFESIIRTRGGAHGLVARADMLADVVGGGLAAGGLVALVGYGAAEAITAGTAIVILSTWVRRLFLGRWIDDTVNLFSGNHGQSPGLDYTEEYDLVAEGRIDEAIARFEARSDARGGDPGPLIEAALVLRDRGRFDQVIEMYARAMEAPGVDAQRATVFARQIVDITGRKLGRPHLAAPHLEALVARFPDSADTEWAWEELTSGEVARSSGMADPLGATGSRIPAVRTVEQILRGALEARASDIHLEDYADGLRVRYRVDGVLKDVDSPPDRIRSAILARIRVMAGLNPAESPIPQDARLRLPFEGREIDLRVSTMPTLHGESVALRILDADREDLALESLGFDPRDLERLLTLVRRPNGMILTTGPGGSGKSTTLHAIVRHLSSGKEKIFTIEDPVEYAIEGVNQVSVNTRAGLTFPTLLRALVRQDPDVILVGEIRDRETAELATHASLTGHLVLSTLHTTDAVSALHRLVDIGVPDYLTVHTLDAVMAQRLVRRACPECAVDGPVTDGQREALGAGPDLRTARVGTGCEACWDTGFRGRLGLFEYLEVNEELRAAFLARAPRAELDRIARANGLRTLREDGVAKIRAGWTTPDEVLRVTTEERS